MSHPLTISTLIDLVVSLYPDPRKVETGLTSVEVWHSYTAHIGSKQLLCLEIEIKGILNKDGTATVKQRLRCGEYTADLIPHTIHPGHSLSATSVALRLMASQGTLSIFAALSGVFSVMSAHVAGLGAPIPPTTPSLMATFKADAP